MALLNITRLEAINRVLNAVGETPVNTIDTSESVEVAIINDMIDYTSRNLQSVGYDFNTIDALILTPDVRDNRIVYPDNLIYVESADIVVAKRGIYLYNVTDRTYEFTAPVTLEAIEALDFEDLPHHFKIYVEAKVSKEYQERYLGDNVLAEELSQKVSEAHLEVMRYDVNRGNYNIIDQNPTISGILRR